MDISFPIKPVGRKAYASPPAGTPARYLGLVLSGMFRIYYTDGNGKESAPLRAGEKLGPAFLQ